MDSRLGDRPCYEFGEFRLDANRRIIEALAANRRLLLPPRVFDAALYFARHPGLLLSKERLRAELWPGMVVEENSLSQVISLLRRAGPRTVESCAQRVGFGLNRLLRPLL